MGYNNILPKLLERAERYCRKHGITETRLGREVARDSNLFADIRAGRSLRLTMIAKIDAYLAEPRKK